jgi:geranylgeranyl diphosphate synthase type I
MEFEKRHNVTEKEYLEMIRKKTAYLFMFSAEGGAVICGGRNEEVGALKRYGESLGLAFQIHDDYLDMSSDEKILGKDIGNDIRNGKKTLIAVHALNNAVGEDKQLLKRLCGNKNASEKDVRSVFDLFNKLKSIEYAKNVAIKYNKDAKNALRVLDDSPTALFNA